MEQHLITVVVSVTGVVVSAIIIAIGRLMCKKQKAKAERMDNMEKKVIDMDKKMERKMGEIDEKVDKLVSAIENITEEIKVLAPIRDGQITVSRYRLTKMYEIYYEAKEITQPELDKFLDMYKPYKSLVGDVGECEAMAQMVKYVKSLPIVKERKKVNCK